MLDQIFCLHGGLSPSIETLDHIRALDRVQEVSTSVAVIVSTSAEYSNTAVVQSVPGFTEFHIFSSQGLLGAPFSFVVVVSRRHDVSSCLSLILSACVFMHE